MAAAFVHREKNALRRLSCDQLKRPVVLKVQNVLFARFGNEGRKFMTGLSNVELFALNCYLHTIN